MKKNTIILFSHAYESPGPVLNQTIFTPTSVKHEKENPERLKNILYKRQEHPKKNSFNEIPLWR